MNSTDKILNDIRFSNITPFENRVWLSSPTMHGDEQRWVDEAIRTNWVSTVGENIDEVEKISAGTVGRKYAVGLSCGTAALHLAISLCAQKIYGRNRAARGVLEGRKVFASDLTFDATVNPIAYEGGEAVFIDSERETWNMDPDALKEAFKKYPDVRLVVIAHLYGIPAKIDELKEICKEHNALIVEDAAESFGAAYKAVQTGMFGDVSVLSFNGNKIVTGSSGGMFLTDNRSDADAVRKWSTQSRENAPWYQHEELGYNYRMSNIVAGVIRGQLPYLDEHIKQKRDIYNRYKLGLADLPVEMNPFDEENSLPNFWLSCITIDQDAMCRQTRTETEAVYTSEPGKSCPAEIFEALAAFNAEARPIWKPMHMQPIYRDHLFFTGDGEAYKRFDDGRAADMTDIGADIFERGLCLPSDNKMTPEQQDKIIEIIHRCFD